jgi:SAM-dependent methyltransferase
VAEWYRIAFGELYPVVYPHRDVAEAARVAARLAPLVRAARPALDVACGNGRYMDALLSSGVDIYGVDLSEYLLGEAARRRLAGRVVYGDMRALPFRDGAFGAAINMFTSFGYFDDEDNARALREIARVIGPGGTFLLDFINAGRAREFLRPESRRDAGDAAIREWRELSGDGRVLEKRVEVSWPGREPVRYAEHLRLYDLAELTAMLGACGLAVRRAYGDYELGDFDARVSERLILACEKRGTEK